MKIREFLIEHKEKIVLLLLAVWIGFIVFSLFYVVSYLITTPGAFFLFFVCVGGLIYVATRLATFPGAYLLWRKTLEKSALQSISSSAAKKLEILSAILLAAKDDSFTEIYERVSFNTMQSIPKTFERIIKNLEYVKTIKLSEEQQKVMSLMISLTNSLQSIKFVAKQSECNLYAFLCAPSVYRSVKFLNLDEVDSALETINEIYVKIVNGLKQPSSLKELVLWLNPYKSYLFGSIDYMRNDIIDKLGAEQIWLTSFDGCKIDW